MRILVFAVLLALASTGCGGRGDRAEPLPAPEGWLEVAPSFALVPSATVVEVPRGGIEILDVEIVRTGGFSDPIVLAADTLPPGITAAPVIAIGESSVTMVFHAVPDAPEVVLPVSRITGRAYGIEVSFSIEVHVKDPAGDPDASFGKEGRVTLAGPEGSDLLVDSVEREGDLLSAGSRIVGSRERVLVSRVGRNGDIAWVRTVDLGFEVQRAGAIAARSAGGVLVAGEADGDLLLAAIGEDGEIDPSFANGGWTTIDLGGRESAFVVIPIPEGWLVGGTSAGASQDGIVMKVRPDGAVAFTTRLSWGKATEVRDLAVDAAGRIVAAVNGRNPGVARLLADGSVDASFGDAGRVALEDGWTRAYAIAVTSDGGVVVAGGRDADLFALRLRADGSANASFGTGGWFRLSSDDARLCAADVAVDGDRIVLAGTSFEASGSAEAVVRLRANGTLDGSFGDGGVSIESESTDGIVARLLPTRHGYVVTSVRSGRAPHSRLTRWTR